MSPQTAASIYTLDFSDITHEDVGRVGGKNASLGEMFRALKPKGVGVLDGFATTADAYRLCPWTHGLEEKLRSIFQGLDAENLTRLSEAGLAARTAVEQTPLPEDLKDAILAAYDRLCQRLGREPEMAVRSSATAEDLPEASFAGAGETFLNVRGRDALPRAVQACFASLFTDRAISYRARLGYDQLAGRAVGGRRADGSLRQGQFRRDLHARHRIGIPRRRHRLGRLRTRRIRRPGRRHARRMDGLQAHARRPDIAPSSAVDWARKEVRLVYADGSKGTRSEPTPPERTRSGLLPRTTRCSRLPVGVPNRRRTTPLSPATRSRWTSNGRKTASPASSSSFKHVRRRSTHRSRRPRSPEMYRLTAVPGVPLVRGQAVGEKIGVGRVRVVRDVDALATVQPGEVLVAEMTDPDWEPVMRRVAAIVTDKGGRTAHAAIVSREFGLPCIVGTGTGHDLPPARATRSPSVAQRAPKVTSTPARSPSRSTRIDAAAVPATRTKVMLIVGDPSRAFSLSAIPNAGVGLARTEFIVTNHVGIHPMALARYPQLQDRRTVTEIAARIGSEDAKTFFVQSLQRGHCAHRGGLLPQAGHRPYQRLQDERVRRAAGRSRIRADRREPDDRFPRGLAVLRRAVCRRASRWSVPRCCGCAATSGSRTSR